MMQVILLREMSVIISSEINYEGNLLLISIDRLDRVHFYIMRIVSRTAILKKIPIV